MTTPTSCSWTAASTPTCADFLPWPDAANRTQIEIDVAVLAPTERGRPRKVLSLGEAKWDRVMDLRHLERLPRARHLLAVKGFDTGDTVLTCYSGAGFDRELQAGQRQDIRLVGLDQLYADEGPSRH